MKDTLGIVISEGDYKKLQALKRVGVKRSPESPSSSIEIFVEEKDLLCLLGIHPIKVSPVAKWDITVN